MNKNEFIKEIKALNINISEEQLLILDELCEELISYNKKTNLTSIVDKDQVYLKHFYDSATISKIIDLNSVNNLIDIGTGAGFPGLIIKILFPNINVSLLDSNNKKIKWLQYISDKLNINVDIIYDRVENYAKNNLNEFDVVTSRAVSNLRVLSEISLPLVKENGYFIPLKGKIEEELAESETTLDYFSATVIKKETFNLYQNEGLRNILLIKKTLSTNISSLRQYDKILKKPLKN